MKLRIAWKVPIEGSQEIHVKMVFSGVKVKGYIGTVKLDNDHVLHFFGE